MKVTVEMEAKEFENLMFRSALVDKILASAKMYEWNKHAASFYIDSDVVEALLPEEYAEAKKKAEREYKKEKNNNV